MMVRYMGSPEQVFFLYKGIYELKTFIIYKLQIRNLFQSHFCFSFFNPPCHKKKKKPFTADDF